MIRNKASVLFVLTEDINTLPYETKFTTIIHPSAVVFASLTLTEGTIISAGTILNCNIVIGFHAHLNLHTTINHACQIVDYSASALAVNIGGNCCLGDGVYLGANAENYQK